MPALNRLRRGVASLGCLAVLLTSACSAFRDDAKAATEAPPTTSTLPVPFTELLSPGTGPRRQLRFDLKADEVTLEVTSDVDIRQEGPGEPVLVDLPPIRQTIRITTTPRGQTEADLEIVFEKLTVTRTATLTESERSALKKRIDDLTGTRATGRIDDHGRIDRLDFAAPPQIDDDMEAMLDEMASKLSTLVAPLPDEAVGVGARWRSTTKVEVSGTTVPITTVFEITSIDGDSISYTSTSEGRASDLSVPTADVATDTNLRIIEVRTTGQGTGTLSLTSLATTSDVRSESKQKTAAKGPKGTVTVLQDTVSHVTIEPVPRAADQPDPSPGPDTEHTGSTGVPASTTTRPGT